MYHSISVTFTRFDWGEKLEGPSNDSMKILFEFSFLVKLRDDHKLFWKCIESNHAIDHFHLFIDFSLSSLDIYDCSLFVFNDHLEYRGGWLLLWIERKTNKQFDWNSYNGERESQSVYYQRLFADSVSVDDDVVSLPFHNCKKLVFSSSFSFVWAFPIYDLKDIERRMSSSIFVSLITN